MSGNYLLRERLRQKAWLNAAKTAIIILAVLAPFTSPWMCARKVIVEGVMRSDAPTFEKILSSIQNQAIYRVNKNKLGASLLQNPRLDNVEFRFGFPFTMKVKAEYRKIAFIISDGSMTFMMDAKLIPFERMPTPIQNGKPDWSLATVPVIRVAKLQTVALGEAFEDYGIKGAAEAIKLSFEKKLASQVQADVDPAGNICLNIEGVAPVRLGNSDRLYEKIGQLERILEHMPAINDNVEYFDISYPELPVRKRKR